MNLGWSDGGRGDLRAGNVDRDAVSALLRAARDEGRLDDAEHDRRAVAVGVAKTRRDLAALTAAATYADLRLIVDGLPGWSGTAEPDRLAGDADRDAALAALSDAVADRRVQPAEAPARHADIRQARRVRDLDALRSALAARVGDRKRRDALEVLAAAHRDGRLDAAEHLERAGRVPTVAGDADLGDLVADLRGEARRLTEAERAEVAGRLRTAFDEGRLDLAEFDERVRAAHAATTAAEIVPLVADLAVPPPPARRGWTDALFDRFVANSAMLPRTGHRRLRWVWKSVAAAALLTYGLFAVFWDTTFTLVVGSWALFAVLGAATGVARLFAEPGDLRRRALEPVQAGLDRLAAAHPAIEKFTVVYPVVTGEGTEKSVRRGTAEVDVSRTDHGRTFDPDVREEIVRLFWQSRLYPLTEIRFRAGDSATLTGAEAKRLSHRYGPRPYGPTDS